MELSEQIDWLKDRKKEDQYILDKGVNLDRQTIKDLKHNIYVCESLILSLRKLETLKSLNKSGDL